MKKERSLFWDNYKGILILLVVFGHFIYAYADNLKDSLAYDIYRYIYVFHMPAFIFCSGYFSRSPRASSKPAQTKLLLYYLVFNTLMLLFAHFYLGSSVKFLTPYYSFWYILSLVLWRAMIAELGKVRGLLVLSVLVALLLGYWSEFTNALSLRRTLAFFPFFVAGYQLNSEKVERFISGRKPLHMCGYGVAAVLVMVAAWWAVEHFRITPSATLLNAYSNETSIIRRVVIFCTAAAVIGALLLAVPNRRIPLLSQFGKNSLLIYLGHRFLTILYYKELFPWKSYTDMYLLYALAASVVTCVVLGNDRLNAGAARLCQQAAEAILDPESRKGNLLKMGMIIVFILLLLLKAMPQLRELLG